MGDGCIKQLEKGPCGRETVPDSNYCKDHDLSRKHRVGGGGGGKGLLDSDLKELGKVYHHDPKMGKVDLKTGGSDF
jgi:hypothetical protein